MRWHPLGEGGGGKQGIFYGTGKEPVPFSFLFGFAPFEPRGRGSSPTMEVQQHDEKNEEERTMEYDPSLERQMLSYFGGHDDSEYPTFSHFARCVGLPLAQLESWRQEIPAFRAVWEECRARQKAKLICGGLTKTFDPSFAKFLLCHEFGFGEENTEAELTVTVEVVE